MNAAGIMYLKGTGTDTSYSEASRWFEKAAMAGYANAYYNLGIMHKYAYGFPVNYSKAFEYFTKAADLGSTQGQYIKGFMLYKGLGCKQDYNAAMELFNKSKDYTPSIYMIGICYRNGFGVKQDTAIARQWLNKAAAAHFYQATEELACSLPENQNSHGLLKAVRVYDNNIPATFKRVKHNISSKNISGLYSGYIITYDWSGQYVLKLESLKLQLNATGDSISGLWTESDTLKANISALSNDSNLIFTNAQYSRVDHYHHKPVPWQFKTGNLEIIDNGNSVQLSGNIQLYSPLTMEPEKPLYITVSRDALTGSNTVPADTKINSDQVFLAYPNPFKNELNLVFSLDKTASVLVTVYSISGKKVYEANFSACPQGSNTLILPLIINPGIYNVTIQYGCTVLTRTVVKQ
jgi:hypothetical protein